MTDDEAPTIKVAYPGKREQRAEAIKNHILTICANYLIDPGTVEVEIDASDEGMYTVKWNAQLPKEFMERVVTPIKFEITMPKDV